MGMFTAIPISHSHVILDLWHFVRFFESSQNPEDLQQGLFFSYDIFWKAA